MNIIKDITDRLSALLDGREGFASSVLFDCGDAGVVCVDGTSGTVKVSSTESAHSCRIAMSAQTFLRILDGEIDETAAFQHGEMRLSGDIGLATEVSNFMRTSAQALAQLDEEPAE